MPFDLIKPDFTGLDIAKGNVEGHSVVHKFGTTPDFDTSDNEVTIWGGAEDATAWELMRYVYSTTAAIDSMSSTDDGDTQDIVIIGLDSNWDEVIQTVTLTGQTRVALSTSLIRVYRAYNDNATLLAGHVIIYENDTTIDDPGVPDDSTLIRALIHPTNNQTEMALYTIPNGYTGYLSDLYYTTAGASRTTDYTVKLNLRLFEKIFRLKFKASLLETGDTSIDHEYTPPLRIPEKTDIETTAQSLVGAVTAATISSGFTIVLVKN